MRPSVWGKPRGLIGPWAALPVVGIAFAAAVAIWWLEPAAPPLAGRAEAVDGDTLRMGSTRIRLRGLDAPELDQTCTRADGREWSCGAEARRFLAARVRDGTVECDRYGRDIYGRTLAKCTSGGADLGSLIVRAGWAVSNDDYLAEADEARAAAAGIWSGAFDRPVDWRHTHGADRTGFWEWIRSWFQ